MAFEEDLTVFLDTDVGFGVKALILDTGAEVQVIFDNGYQDGLGGAFESSQPTALGASAQLQSLVHGSVLLLPKAVGSAELEAWRVVNVQPDGTGMTRLMMERNP